MHQSKMTDFHHPVAILPTVTILNVPANYGQRKRPLEKKDVSLIEVKVRVLVDKLVSKPPLDGFYPSESL